MTTTFKINTKVLIVSLYPVLSQSCFGHVVLPLNLHLYLLRDIRHHQVNKTTDEENHVLWWKNRRTFDFK